MNKCTLILKISTYSLHKQYGFRQNCSTSQAMRQLYDDFLEILDKKDYLFSVCRPE